MKMRVDLLHFSDSGVSLTLMHSEIHADCYQVSHIGSVRVVLESADLLEF